jgi:hypothetical protein
MTIVALRILPPLAFARFGSASEPQPNYVLEVNDDNPLGFRKIVRAPTLIVNADGSIVPAADQPAAKLADGIGEIFRQGEAIRPVAPFFEVYAITDEDGGKLVPLTLAMLGPEGTASIKWEVRVANRKVFRRTDDPNDIIHAETGLFGGHARVNLEGISIKYFEEKTSVNFGHVQFIRPEESDPIRLRFTPGPGRIYGPIETPPSKDYVTPIYKKEGTWRWFNQLKPGTRKLDSDQTWPPETLPPSLFAIKPPAPPWLHDGEANSLGYIDDACDGFIVVNWSPPNQEPLQAKARICVGPPSFVPDCHFIRTLADDLEQVLNGPRADSTDDVAIDAAAARGQALEIVRRAYEAVRFMNVAVMNGNPVNGRRADAFDSMPAEESFTTARPLRPVMPPASVDTAAILALHQQVFATLSAGVAPWFVRLLRQPEEVGDLTDRGRRKMPALMSGADGLYLALTHRQIATIVKAADAGMVEQATEPASGPGAKPTLTPRNLTAQLYHEAAGNPVNSRPEMAIANCCPGLEVDFRAVWRRLFKGIELNEHGNYVVAGSAVDSDGKPLKGRRLLGVGGKPVLVQLMGPSPSDPDGKIPILSPSNPHGVWTMEWSNCFAHVVDELRAHGTAEVNCDFTLGAEEQPRSYDPKMEGTFTRVKLTVENFFESDTAVISEQLAAPGELTQGLCSPWQNDLRECSCYYWASSRPDFVNTYVGDDGLSHGDNWFARVRTGRYVPDDYADPRLIGYEELFKDWEKTLQFQIGGKDSAPTKADSPAPTPPRKQ